ncbi:MAG: hypothetical protein ACK4Y5_13870 [Acetobacteraceae bacterium]|jgi:MOSC domain-containing protein YiiM|nr:hypothetical protein [Roseomonas sp.]MCA3370649.1 hypothetical protein [Roseomonas sp.]MCE2760315.1 MOSC domain-containing protein [Acetobacteraceae bacterium]
MTAPYIQALASDGAHRFSKQPAQSLTLLTGLGVEGDAHAGVTVKHRSRVARDPSQPNLRQLHLLHAEIFEELAPQGFALKSGDIGENVTTRGLDLLGLGTGTRLCLGTAAISVERRMNPGIRRWTPAAASTGQAARRRD